MFSNVEIKNWLQAHGCNAWIKGDKVVAECELVSRHGAVAIEQVDIRTMKQARDWMGY